MDASNRMNEEGIRSPKIVAPKVAGLSPLSNPSICRRTVPTKSCGSLTGCSSMRYMGGTTDAPTYDDVCTDTTGHVEVVEVSYDPSRISRAAEC